MSDICPGCGGINGYHEPVSARGGNRRCLYAPLLGPPDAINAASVVGAALLHLATHNDDDREKDE